MAIGHMVMMTEAKSHKVWLHEELSKFPLAEDGSLSEGWDIPHACVNHAMTRYEILGRREGS